MRWSDVTLCYLMLLNRLPSEEEAAAGRLQGISGILSDLVSTRDFARRLLSVYFGTDQDDRHSKETQRFYEFIGEIGNSRLAALSERIRAIPSKPHDGHDYVAFHCRRIVELVGFLERWHRDHPITSVLDVGFSPFFSLYPELFPGIEAFLVDVSPPSQDFLNRIGAKGGYKIDLNKQSISSALGGPVERHFDVIVFTEVVEHLLLDPAEALKDLLGLLNPGGIIYFSTPNYLNSATVEKLLDRGNPQQRYTKADGNRGNHYHLREYTLYELEDAARRAGGELAFYAYSDCWDRDTLSAERLEELPVGLRSNLVLIVRNADGNLKPTDAGNPVSAARTAEISSTDANKIVEAFTIDQDQLIELDVRQAGVALDRLTFDENWYVKSNRDVADAIREGIFKSGWDHYVSYGKQEGRPVRRRLLRVRDSK